MDDPLARAVTETFVYVAAADGDLAAPELERFVAWASEQAPLAEVPRAELAARFGDVAAAFRRDFTAAESHALDAVRAVRGLEGAAELLLSAAGVAVVADGALREVEESAVDRIAEALRASSG